MFVTIPKGLIWMVSGSIVSSMLSLIINTYYTGKLINIGYFKQMSDLLPIFGVSFVMWITIHVSLLLITNIVLQLFVGIIVGVIVYLIGAKLLLCSEWNDVQSVIPYKIKKKFNIFQTK